MTQQRRMQFAGVFARGPLFRLRANLHFERREQTFQVRQEWRRVQPAAVRVALGASQDEASARAGAGDVAVVTFVAELRELVWAEHNPPGFELFAVGFGEKSRHWRNG